MGLTDSSCRGRVIAALAHRPPGIVPYHLKFTAPARRTMADFYGDADFERRLGNHLAFVPAIRVEFGRRDADGFYTDEYGTRWDRRMDEDLGVPQPLLTPENLDGFRWPDPDQPGRFDRLRQTRREEPDKFLLMSLNLSLFERSWALAGMEDFLAAMLADPGFAGAVLDRVLEFNLGLIRAGLRACPDLDGVYFGDDFGTQLGLMMGPDLWRELLAPRLARQYAAVRERGKKVFIHCCGKVDEIFEDLVQLGLDCFNPFQPEVMDVFALKERFRGRLAFYGGISTQRLLPYGSPGEVRERVAELLERLGRSGGYIASPAHAIPGDAPAENIHAMIETLKGQGA
jgi:uroporphyrinogen decarboxylase